ncbi:hypothetical protein [Streptomyces sp. CB01881]|uniref:hypothetical protein n=1 Tax=Streptomyces sp. CB01881 TaxID=2078691 RepID=UPI000CDBD42C|nr:hypothetical protein [Streptomyces sp. CB01881]AUY53486.1 hypothetical protein C2142_36570 [Streptomyces sp. CB01881]TYC69635.1 hypothetical protein EH183_36610 [Streptomyces sp. CB01881]
MRVFDAVWRRELLALPAVEGALFGVGGLLYAASPRGLEAWDPATGELLATVEGFVPTHHHPGAGEFAAFDGTALHRRPVPVAG